jgi:L-cystine uptake protein TcyP (sodium:dicarboxylate symporter family)
MMNLIGIVLPVLIDYINGKMVNKYARFLIAFMVCAVFGVIANVVETNGFHGYITIRDYVEGIAQSILAMFGVAQIVYQGGYSDSTIHDNVRKIAMD